MTIAGWWSFSSPDATQKAVFLMIWEVVVVMPTIVSRMSGGGALVRMEETRVWMLVRREVVRVSRKFCNWGRVS